VSLTANIDQYAGRLRSFVAQQNGRRLAILATALALFAIGAAVALDAYQHQMARIYNVALLAALWSSYKQHDWDGATGRTFDPQNDGVTTSESQGYTMLRAVWSDDRPTFLRTWQWTAAHLQRPDHLFSWRYGTGTDGRLGILTDQGGENTASDADIDIATALLLASERWSVGQYRTLAVPIVRAVWEQEVVAVNGRLYVAADNIEKTADTRAFIVNPSYLAPYAFRLFSQADSGHNWTGLVSDTYTFLQRVSIAKLGSSNASGLPPDWVQVDRHTGAIQASTMPAQTTDFGYDAFRVLWRVGLDWQWFHAADALRTFKAYELLENFWDQHHKLAAIYHHDGRPAVDYESVALYSGVLGYFKAVNSGAADDIVRSKITPLYDPARHALAGVPSYYTNNWLWLGLALYENRLANSFGQRGRP
jgi:endoglucanase